MSIGDGWAKFTPSKLSWLQIDPTGQIVIVENNQLVPKDGVFRIELENGTILERTTPATPDFRVKLPTPQGYSVSEYRPMPSGKHTEWETRQLQAEASTPTKQVPINKTVMPKLEISIKAVEVIATGLFVVIVLVQVLFIDQAMKKKPIQTFQQPPTEVDTSDEYVPDTNGPLPVKRNFN